MASLMLKAPHMETTKKGKKQIITCHSYRTTKRTLIYGSRKRGKSIKIVCPWSFITEEVLDSNGEQYWMDVKGTKYLKEFA